MPLSRERDAARSHRDAASFGRGPAQHQADLSLIWP